MDFGFGSDQFLIGRMGIGIVFGLWKNDWVPKIGIGSGYPIHPYFGQVNVRPSEHSAERTFGRAKTCVEASDRPRQVTASLIMRDMRK